MLCLPSTPYGNYNAERNNHLQHYKKYDEMIEKSKQGYCSGNHADIFFAWRSSTPGKGATHGNNYRPTLSQGKKKHPEFLSAVESLGKAAKKAGPLDEKTAHLIQIAGAAAIRSEGSVHSHAARALEAGAQSEEIYHAIILLTSTIGFPNVMAALSWVDDIVEDKSPKLPRAGQ